MTWIWSSNGPLSCITLLHFGHLTTGSLVYTMCPMVTWAQFICVCVQKPAFTSKLFANYCCPHLTPKGTSCDILPLILICEEDSCNLLVFCFLRIETSWSICLCLGAKDITRSCVGKEIFPSWNLDVSQLAVKKCGAQFGRHYFLTNCTSCRMWNVKYL